MLAVLRNLEKPLRFEYFFRRSGEVVSGLDIESISIFFNRARVTIE
jgi:hypothetical protein